MLPLKRCMVLSSASHYNCYLNKHIALKTRKPFQELNAMQDEFIMQIKDEDFTENLYSMCGHAKSIKNNLQTYQDKAESVIEHS